METPTQKEQRLKRQRAYEARRKENDPIGFKKAQEAAALKYRLNNKNKMKEATRKWRENNREKYNSARRLHRSINIEKSLYKEARSRAKKHCVEFTIRFEDLPPMGTHCPIFGDAFIARGERGVSPFSPSIDRIDPSIGYVKGNVWFIGYRANLVKNDGTAEEHEKIAHAMRLKLCPRNLT